LEQKIAWMRERIHDKPGAQDLTAEEQKTVVRLPGEEFFQHTPRVDPNGRLSRTALQGDAARYNRGGFCGTESDAALHDITVDPRALPG